MRLSKDELLQICLEALEISHETDKKIGEMGSKEVASQKDIVTQADLEISKSLVDYFKSKNLPVILYSEESGRLKLSEDPKLIITFDDLDGTDNYFRGRRILPYCTVVTIFDSLETKFKDALIAGVIEHTSGKLWYAMRDDGCYSDDVKNHTSGRKILDRKTSVIIDQYGSSENISKFLKIYPRAWIKDFGSSAFHLAGVSSGMFDVFLSPANKAHELGAGYLLIKEAGGTIVDFTGDDYGNKVYDFDAKYPIIAAATPKFAKEILKLIEK